MRVDLAKIRHFHFARHGVLAGHKASSIEDAASRAVGIHAARLQSPYAALHARCDDFTNGCLDEELYAQRSLIKLRCMRRTLHIMPLGLAAIAHTATKRQRITPCETAYRHLGVTQGELCRARDKVLETAHVSPIDNRSIQFLGQQAFGRRADGEWTARATRWVIKGLWEEGLLCYVNRAKEWGTEDRAYAFTQSNYPTLRLDDVPLDVAETKLVLFHIQQYGPVSLQDICWWSGLSRGRVEKAILRNESRLRWVDVEPLGKQLIMSLEDVEKLNGFVPPDSDWIALLAYEDSALKGYFGTRSRYVECANYSSLFNCIGEVRASVVLNGEAVGTWTYDKKDGRIAWSAFRHLTSPQVALVRDHAHMWEAKVATTRPSKDKNSPPITSR